MSSDEPKILSFKQSKKEVNFKAFARLVADNKLDEATRIFRDLLSLDFEKAKSCTEHFKNKFDNDPSIIMRTMHLRTLAQAGEHNKALMQIQDIFNLSGPDAIAALEKIKEIANA